MIRDDKLKHSLKAASQIIAALIIGSIGVGYFVQNNHYIQRIDTGFYEIINGGPHPEWLNLLVAPVNFNLLPVLPQHLPSFTYIMIAGLLGYMWYTQPKRFKWVLLCLVIGFLLSRAISILNWEFVFRNRPFLDLPSTIDTYGQSVWAKYSSFPSGHARDTALYGAMIAAFIPKLRWSMIILVFFVAYSRVYLGAHYPTDVIAGVIIGYLAAKVGIMVSSEIQRVREDWVGKAEDLGPASEEI